MVCLWEEISMGDFEAERKTKGTLDYLRELRRGIWSRLILWRRVLAFAVPKPSSC